mmetsp:Transcript_12568/g.19027  ORF Transcript_12568/g.19027 Transcript_12568/m.19027 type:complete len:156 (-) Transcript_12568:1416-1883(-)
MRNSLDYILWLIVLHIHTTTSFNISRDHFRKSSVLKGMEIVDGLEFDSFAREWKCKCSPRGSDGSLLACQMALEAVFDDLMEVDGVTNVERFIDEDCLEFKVVTSVDADNFSEWKKNKFDPEEFFVEMLEVIEGVSEIETQTFKKMTVVSTEFIE